MGTLSTSGSLLKSKYAKEYKVSTFGRTISVKLALGKTLKLLIVFSGPRPGPAGRLGLVVKLAVLSTATSGNP